MRSGALHRCLRWGARALSMKMKRHLRPGQIVLSQPENQRTAPSSQSCCYIDAPAAKVRSSVIEAAEDQRALQ